MLNALGLSTQDELVYRAILELPQLGVAGLALHLKIDEAAVRASLDTLVDLALVRAKDDDSLHAVRPQTGLTVLLARAEAEIQIRQRQVEATRAAVFAIADAFPERDEQSTVRRLEGLEAVRDRLVELAHTASTECLSLTPGGAQHPDTMAAERPLNELAIGRGVVIRNVYLESFRNDPGTLAHARWMASLGAPSRTVATLPMRLVIVDREVALVPLDPAVPSAGALELRTPGVITGLVALFEQIWAIGTSFGDLPTRDDNNLTPQERELVRLLSAGHTDESAGRQLGVSTRSVQRIMTALTEQLGAASRFQAGVEANRRGWI